MIKNNNPLNITDNFSMAIFGAPRSGKTYYINYLLSSYKHIFNYVILICPTHFNGNYKTLENMRHTVLDTNNFDEKLMRIMERQQKFKENDKKCRTLLILDDCADVVTYSKRINNFYSTYRHYNMDVIFTAQHVFSMNTRLRTNCSHAVVFKQNHIKSIKECYESFFGNMKFNQFKEYINFALCQRYTFLYIDVYNDKVKVMKCP